MKKIIRHFFNKFGYDIVKTDNWFISKSRRKKIVQVGNYQISMPGSNTLVRTYTIYPDINGNLGRLAAHVGKKYSGMTVVDIGANVGDTIAIIRSAIDVPVIGIEGDDISFQYLTENTGQFLNVTIVKAFLGEKKQNIRADIEQTGRNTTIIQSERGSETISLTTLDDILGEKRFENIILKLIKIDAEGFDTIILRGSDSIIKKHKPVLYFEYNRDNMIAINEEGLFTILSLAGIGYNKIIFFDRMGRLLLSTSLKDQMAITCLHDYISSPKNLLGYLDICIFHEDDDMLAASFFLDEQKYLNNKV